MHYSVLLNEAIDSLNIDENGIYVDATLGYGGHSSLILSKLNKGFLYSFDQDIDAINYSNDRLSKISNSYEIIKSNFVNLKEELKKKNIDKINGIIFDLGVSSPQLDEKDRGFSYHQDSRLDMRMDKDNPLSAYEVVNNYSKNDLIKIFRDYGEEKFAVSIANNILKYREKKNIETTLELVDIIKLSVPERVKREKNPAKKVFQAIRIEVNNELDVLSKALEDAISILKPGGRIVVITFHSLEDRIVKNIFKKYSEVPKDLKMLPFVPLEYQPILKLINKDVILPSKKELEENRRSRSAKMRIAERIR